MPKLLQLNMWGGRLEKQIADFVKREQPDILCLQEAISYDQEDTAMFLSIENLQKFVGIEHAAIAPVFSFKLMNSTARFGNVILSRYPILKSEVIFTRLGHQDDFDFNEHDYNIRNFIHAVVSIDGQPVNIITHHGHHVHAHKNGDEETMRQVGLLVDYVKALEGPVIVTGDFNLHPKSESLDLLNKQLENLSITHKLKTTRNNLTHKKEVCDYIFVNDAVQVKKFSMPEEVVSDHQALMLEF
ncbi:MAG: hypothetical protein JWL85_975 [Candidatus Saccharibacteria bacterium]|nr:hypothetical protein [Candidatus Saccharibacteria bacterium]